MVNFVNHFRKKMNSAAMKRNSFRAFLIETAFWLLRFFSFSPIERFHCRIFPLLTRNHSSSA